MKPRAWTKTKCGKFHLQLLTLAHFPSMSLMNEKKSFITLTEGWGLHLLLPEPSWIREESSSPGPSHGRRNGRLSWTTVSTFMFFFPFISFQIVEFFLLCPNVVKLLSLRRLRFIYTGDFRHRKRIELRRLHLIYATRQNCLLTGAQTFSITINETWHSGTQYRVVYAVLFMLCVANKPIVWNVVTLIVAVPVEASQK
jgi:hypothetical protein